MLHHIVTMFSVKLIKSDFINGLNHVIQISLFGKAESYAPLTYYYAKGLLLR